MDSKTYCGMDYHKKSTELCVMDGEGKIIEQVRVESSKVIQFLSNRKEYVIGIEASGGTFEVTSKLKALGHTVKIINPVQFKAIGMGGKKTDKKDALAIATALRVGFIPEVHHKSEYARQLKSLLASREQACSIRIQITNHVRGILREYGLPLPVGVENFWVNVGPALKELECIAIRETLQILVNQAFELKKQESVIEKTIETITKDDERIQRLQEVPGVGLLSAVAFIGSIDDITRFKSGKELSSYIGITPRESSSGSKRRLGSITKCGSEMLRRYLIHGARTCLRYKSTPEHRQRIWAEKLENRIGTNKAAVALAHKNARTCFAMLRDGTKYNEKKKTSQKAPA